MNYDIYNRRKSIGVRCGQVKIGDFAPISIQSMTNTDTRNIVETVEQIIHLEEAGCDIVRLAIPDMEAAEAFGEIKKKSKLPLVADIHFDYRLALEVIKKGADKVRINPGNIGDEDRVKSVVNLAKEHKIPIRIGVNSGSLEKNILSKYGGVTPEGVCESALAHVKILENLDFNDIIISIKSSDVKLNYSANKLLADKTPYPLHIGITESGTHEGGKAKSALGIGSLLMFGIGDTIRVSMTGDPVKEVYYAREILKSLNMKEGTINLISCPTCGRCSVDLETITKNLETQLLPLETIRMKEKKASITVAVMGCEVNGPGEAKDADIGVACGKGKGIIFTGGKIVKTVNEQEIICVLMEYLSTI